MATRIRPVLFALLALLVGAGTAHASSAARVGATSVAAATKAAKVKKAPRVKKAAKVKKAPKVATVTLTGQVSTERTAKGRLLSVSLTTDEGDVLIKLDGRARKLAKKLDGGVAECTGKMMTKGKGTKARDWFVLKAWKPVETSDEDDAYDDEEE